MSRTTYTGVSSARSSRNSGRRGRSAELAHAIASDGVEHGVVLADGLGAADGEGGCACAQRSTSAGRSRRRWPPWPKNTGTIVTSCAPSAARSSIVPGRSGVISSRKARRMSTAGCCAMSRSRRRSNGSRQRASRAPCANSTSARAAISGAPPSAAPPGRRPGTRRPARWR